MKAKTESIDVYQIVTDRIIAKLEAGTIPWKHFASSPLAEPKNLVSKKPYHGINHFMLSGTQHKSPYWLTYHQAQELGGSVRKGEKSEIVVFWKFLEVDDKETGEKKEIPFLRYSRVFNVEQCENIAYPAFDETPRDSKPIDAAEQIVAGMPNRPEIKLDDTPKAYYQPAGDYIHMTRREACVSDEAYSETLLHELVHSTGHKSRLNRFEEDGCTHKFGSKSYANEELVAEMGAGFLCAECGIFQQVEDNTAAYIASWLSRLENDKTLVVKAAGKAQKACDYICNRGADAKPTESNNPTEGAPTAPTPEPEQPIATPEPITPTPEPTPAEPTPIAEPQPVSESESTAPEPEPPTAAGQLIPGDFVDDHSILRAIDFVAHTATLEFPSKPRAWKDTKSYHNLLSTFKVIPLAKVNTDTLYAGQVLHRLVEYARPRLVGRAKISKVCFKRITAQLEAAAAAA